MPEPKVDAEGNVIVPTNGEEENSTKVVADEKHVTVKIEIPKVEKDRTYTPEDIQKLVNDAVEAGSKIKGEQLYKEIERLKLKVQANSDKVVTDPVEVEKLKVEQANNLAKLSVLETEFVKSQGELNNLKSELSKEKLESYKAGKIASAEGKLIPELVSGSTKEEIDASIELSKAKYAELHAKIRESAGLPKEVKTPSEDNEQPIEIKRLEKNDIASWEKNRDALLKEVYGAHGLKI